MSVKNQCVDVREQQILEKFDNYLREGEPGKARWLFYNSHNGDSYKGLTRSLYSSKAYYAIRDVNYRAARRIVKVFRGWNFDVYLNMRLDMCEKRDKQKINKSRER